MNFRPKAFAFLNNAVLTAVASLPFATAMNRKITFCFRCRSGGRSFGPGTAAPFGEQNLDVFFNGIPVPNKQLSRVISVGPRDLCRDIPGSMSRKHNVPVRSLTVYK